MKIIVGLGNPGEEYQNTRHNLGYMVLDKLSELLKIDVNKNRLDGLVGTGTYNREKIILVKPLTYMNLSGDCVLKVLKYYKVGPEDLIVIYDDIDVSVGNIRIRPSGSPGTHNGMRDISKKLGTNEFSRVRVGSGRPREFQDLADYVLSNIKKEEKEPIGKAIENAANGVIEMLENGVKSAMNKYN